MLYMIDRRRVIIYALYLSIHCVFVDVMFHIHTLCKCDPLRENVHFRTKCIVEIRVKIAETWSLVAKRDYDTGKNYSLSSTFSRWSDVRAPLLPLTASSQRREVQPRIRARCA